MIIPSILGCELLVWKSQEIKDKRTNFGLCKDSNEMQCDSFEKPSTAEYEFCSKAYGITLVALFLVSSLFHWISWTQSKWQKDVHAGCSVVRPSLSKVFHVCDRSTIYFFIAGSYSPWLVLHYIHDDIAWLQWAIWLGAFLGVSYTIAYLEKYKLLDTLLYVFLGLVPGLLVYSYSTDTAPMSGGSDLITGGAFYLSGVLIFKCDGLIPFAHAIWHIFVACGAFSHYYGVYKNFYTV